jgi:hypothetical protein
MLDIPSVTMTTICAGCLLVLHLVDFTRPVSDEKTVTCNLGLLLQLHHKAGPLILIEMVFDQAPCSLFIVWFNG